MLCSKRANLRHLSGLVILTLAQGKISVVNIYPRQKAEQWVIDDLALFLREHITLSKRKQALPDGSLLTVDLACDLRYELQDYDIMFYLDNLKWKYIRVGIPNGNRKAKKVD